MCKDASSHFSNMDCDAIVHMQLARLHCHIRVDLNR